MVLAMTERTAAASSRRRDRARGAVRHDAGPRGAARPLGAAAVAVGLAGALTLLLGLQRHASVIVHQCLPGEGLAGWLGVRLALLRAAVACPEGAVAVGGKGADVVGVTVMVALPVLL